MMRCAGVRSNGALCAFDHGAGSTWTRATRRCVVYVSCALCFFSINGLVRGQVAADSQWQPVARLDTARLPELSGMVESRICPGVFWGHGDSGNAPRLVAFDLDGRIVAEVDVAAVNADWEDITADDSGHLFVGDIGNYQGLFGVRQIYKVVEPDPENPPKQPIKPIATYQYKLEAGNRFDAESLFWRGGWLHVISKSGGAPTIYRLTPTQDEHELRLVELDAGLPLVPTGADCSADGRSLVVCGYRRCVILALTEDGRIDRSAPQRYISYPNPGGVEAVAFEKDGVVLGAENGAIYQAPPEAFDKNASFR